MKATLMLLLLALAACGGGRPVVGVNCAVVTSCTLNIGRSICSNAYCVDAKTMQVCSRQKTWETRAAVDCQTRQSSNANEPPSVTEEI